MFGSFRARVFAFAASLFIGLWAGPAAAATAVETNPDRQALGSLASPATTLTPAPLSPSVAAAITPKPAAALTMQRLPLHDLVIGFVDFKNQSHEELCLAKAVYFEARGETIEGQLAVAEVVLNRARSGRFASSICGVVTQPAQFSFIRAGKFPAVNESSDCWKKALAIADAAEK